MSKAINVDNLVSNKTSYHYPNILLLGYNDALPLIANILKKGDMQVILNYEGQQRVIARIAECGSNIDWLLRTLGTFRLYLSPTEYKDISTFEDYL